MTAVVEPEAAPETPPEERKRRSRKRGTLGNHVAGVVKGLQDNVLSDKPRPEAVAALARLRRAIGREPGFDYTLDQQVGLPDKLFDKLKEWSRNGEPTHAEHAKHTAVTLYALHQQSQRQPMHVDDRGLGHAIRELVRKAGKEREEGVRRRFAALGTAISFDEVIYHLRSLIVMLREYKIPLDYGLLADDLRALRRPDKRASIQAAWGREYFRARPTNNEESETDTNEESLP